MSSIQKIGKDWKRFPSYLRGYSRNIPIFSKTLLIGAANLYKRKIEERIESQPQELELSKQALDEKLEHGYSLDIWIRTGFFKKNLLTIQQQKGEVYVGASPNKIHKPSGDTMEERARVMEYGDSSRNIPPRPIFHPAYEEFKKEIGAKLSLSYGLFLKTGGLSVKADKW